MNLKKIDIVCKQQDVGQFESFLEELGALSITVTASDDEEIFEPEINTTPLWQECIISALFDKIIDENVFRAKINQSKASIEFSEIEDQDWKNIWKQEFKTMSFGKRLVICPSYETPKKIGEFTIVLDPGLAFGTGKHPTTSLCLQWLDENIEGGETVIDYGCGSGILAIAASKLGAKRVIAVDIDEQALEATYSNAAANNVSNIETFFPGEVPKIQADIVVANILANPLKELAPTLIALVKPGGKLVLSGILDHQADELIEVYSGFVEVVEMKSEQEWILISKLAK